MARPHRTGARARAGAGAAYSPTFLAIEPFAAARCPRPRSKRLRRETQKRRLGAEPGGQALGAGRPARPGARSPLCARSFRATNQLGLCWARGEWLPPLGTSGTWGLALSPGPLGPFPTPDRALFAPLAQRALTSTPAAAVSARSRGGARLTAAGRPWPSPIASVGLWTLQRIDGQPRFSLRRRR